MDNPETRYESLEELIKTNKKMNNYERKVIRLTMDKNKEIESSKTNGRWKRSEHLKFV